MIQAKELGAGTMIQLEGAIWMVVTQGISGTGKFGKKVHVKLKNMQNGNTTEKSFDYEEKCEDIDVRRVTMQYLYREGDQFVFMSTADYEQYRLSANVVGQQSIFLKENSEIDALFADDKMITVEFPKFVDLKVTVAPEGVKGHGENTEKEVELENGLKILVPQFVKEGETVRVNTMDLSYKERLTTKSLKPDKNK